jgi:hypothetical protein
MTNYKRKFIRYNINFLISSNEIEGKGVNISKKGFGFITNDELIPADSVPFEAKINGGIFGNKKYLIKGVGNVLFSIYRKDDDNYYNGFQFINLDPEFIDIFDKILKVIKELKNKQ